MTNHHGVSFSEFKAGLSGTTAVCLVQALFMQGMVAKAERDLGAMRPEDRKAQAVVLAFERNKVRD